MALVNAKCTHCGENIFIEDNIDAGICPHCNSAYATDNAITLYQQNETTLNEPNGRKKRHIWKSLGLGLLCALECFGYLLYVITFMWLFFDIFDKKGKK